MGLATGVLVGLNAGAREIVGINVGFRVVGARVGRLDVGLSVTVKVGE